MKFIRWVFILLIGMIGMTAFATASKLDQKQKPDFQLKQSFQLNAVNADVAFVASFPILYQHIDVGLEINVRKTTLTKSFVHIRDVGWCSSKQRFSNIPYKEKLQITLVHIDNDYRYCRSNC